MVKKILFLTFFLGFFLRVYHMSSVPVSLYWDEASIGYNAYSIAQTLTDEHGETLPLSRFMAFGDYKAPGYIYLAAMSVKLFGLNEFSIRLPSVLSGALLIIATYFLINLFKLGKRTSLLGSFIVAISPWAVQLSRGAFEGNAATLFMTLGFLFLVKWQTVQNRASFVLSALFFAMSMYTFNSHRFFIPLFLAGWWGVAVLKDCFSQRKIPTQSIMKLATYFCVFILFLLPLLPHMFSREGNLRFQEVTWLNDLDLINISNDRSVRGGLTPISRIIHNRRVVYLNEFLKHYFDNLNPVFLFYSGDVNPRLSSQGTGELYWIDYALLLIGMYILAKKGFLKNRSFLFWLLLAPIPASLARETPHALRVFTIYPLPAIISAVGLAKSFSWFKYGKWKQLFVVIAVLLWSASLFGYLYNYYKVYPEASAMEWQDGYKQMVGYVSSVESQYDHIYVTSRYGRPYIYVLLYSKYEPKKYVLERDVSRDWYGFWYVHKFGKYNFEQNGDHGKWLYILAPDEVVGGELKKIKTISNSFGKEVFYLYEANK